MKNKLLCRATVGIFVLAFAVPVFVGAEDIKQPFPSRSTTSAEKRLPPAADPAFKAQRKETMGDIKNARQAAINDFKSGVRKGSSTPLTASSSRAEIFKQIREEHKEAREKLKEEFAEKREALKKQFETRMEAFKAMKKKLKENNLNNVKNFLAKIREKFQQAIGRLETADEKIVDKIAEAKAEGLDTANVEKLLQTARTEASEAKAAIDAAKLAVDAAVASTTGVSRDALKETMRTTEKALKEAAEAYRKAAFEVRKLLRPLGESGKKDDEDDDDDNATTTATTTATST